MRKLEEALARKRSDFGQRRVMAEEVVTLQARLLQYLNLDGLHGVVCWHQEGGRGGSLAAGEVGTQQWP